MAVRKARGRSQETCLAQYRRFRSFGHTARIESIAKRFGVTTHGVRKALKNTGLSKSEQRFKEMGAGMSYAERVAALAREDGVSVAVIRTSLRRSGILSRHHHQRSHRRTAQVPAVLGYHEKLGIISREFGVYPNAVRAGLKRMGITLANPS